MLFLQNVVQRSAQMVHVRFVECLVAVERAVFLYKKDDRDVTCAVGRPEFAVGILEYGDGCVILVDEHADVIFLDATVQTDSDAREPLGFIFLDEVLDFGEVLLTVRALGAEIVNEQRSVAEMAEQNARIADT